MKLTKQQKKDLHGYISDIKGFSMNAQNKKLRLEEIERVLAVLGHIVIINKDEVVEV